MPGLPALIIIARHGARLDAADTNWIYSSPTPYDPPLTNGGWTQSRALGARVGAILHARERSTAKSGQGRDSRQSSVVSISSDDGQSTTSTSGSNRRRHKVFIHSSPFLRCLQTSVGIAAGIAQYHAMPAPPSVQSPKPAQQLFSPQYMKPDSLGSAALKTVEETQPAEEPPERQKPRRRRKFRKPLMRVDACLGEWLTPEYYEHITPPPSSTTMIQAAKAELGRPSDYSARIIEANSPKQAFPGGWSNKKESKEPLSSMSSLTQSLPKIGRHNSEPATKVTPTLVESPSGYVPPTSTYLAAASDQIPAGFVTHARDACIEINFQWDSMRLPQNWGDGGIYGEEWSAMHQRFRRALENILTWYRDKEETEDDNTDSVLVIVTHGAGCNALLGALTDQPVLMDVGVASLTMAVRNDTVHSPDAQSPGTFPRRPRKGFSDDYDVKLLASTEHLRADANPLSLASLAAATGGQTSSSNVSAPAAALNQYRHRLQTSGVKPISPAGLGAPASSLAFLNENSSHGSHGQRRSSGPSPMPKTVDSRTGGRAHRAFTVQTSGNAPVGLTGLWSRPTLNSPLQNSPAVRSSEEAIENDDGDDLVLNFGGRDQETDQEAHKDKVKRSSSVGLWGSAA